MSEQALFRLTKGGHSRKEDGRFRHYKAGNEILLSESEQRKLKDRVVLLRSASQLQDQGEAKVAQTSTETSELIQPPTPRKRRSRRS